MARDLPGFYYDEERRRYFKIQPNHLAVPRGQMVPRGPKPLAEESPRPSGSDDTSNSPRAAGYAKGAVKRKRATESVQRQRLTWAERGAVETVRRSRILEDSRTGGRELTIRLGCSGCGTGSGASNASGRYWAAHATRHTVPPPNSLDGQYDCKFKYNKGDSCLYGGISPWGLWPVGYSARSWHRSLKGCTNICELVVPTGFKQTAGRAITVTGTDESSRLVVMSSKADPGLEHALQHITFSRPNTSFQVVYQFESTVNDVHACPAPNDSIVHVPVAFAHTDGVKVALPTSGRFDMDLSDLKCMGHKEQMAVRYRDQQTLLAGARSGKIRLADLRADKSVIRLGHSSAVSALRWINNSLVLVNGLSSMCVYDIRFARPPAIASTAPGRGHQARIRNGKAEALITPSHPYLDFAIPPDRTSDRYGLGFDYDPEMHVAAVGSSSSVHGHRVTLYSMTTGKIIDGGNSDLARTQYVDAVTCVEWARVRDGPKSLLLATSGTIEEWTPQGSEADDERQSCRLD